MPEVKTKPCSLSYISLTSQILGIFSANDSVYQPYFKIQIYLSEIKCACNKLVCPCLIWLQNIDFIRQGNEKKISLLNKMFGSLQFINPRGKQFSSQKHLIHIMPKYSFSTHKTGQKLKVQNLIVHKMFIKSRRTFKKAPSYANEGCKLYRTSYFGI